MAKFRVTMRDGTTYIMGKRASYGSLKEKLSWMRAYNKHNTDKISSVVQVKESSVKRAVRKKVNALRTPTMAELMRM